MRPIASNYAAKEL